LAFISVREFFILSYQGDNDVGKKLWQALLAIGVDFSLFDSIKTDKPIQNFFFLGSGQIRFQKFLPVIDELLQINV